VIASGGRLKSARNLRPKLRVSDIVATSGAHWLFPTSHALGSPGGGDKRTTAPCRRRCRRRTKACGRTAHLFCLSAFFLSLKSSSSATTDALLRNRHDLRCDLPHRVLRFVGGLAVADARGIVDLDRAAGRVDGCRRDMSGVEIDAQRTPCELRRLPFKLMVARLTIAFQLLSSRRRLTVTGWPRAIAPSIASLPWLKESPGDRCKECPPPRSTLDPFRQMSQRVW
jgi:hypothetical protein